MDATKLRAARIAGTSTVTITAEGTAPSNGYVVWLERSGDPTRLYAIDVADEFVLYQEQQGPTPSAPAPFQIDDPFDVPIGVNKLTVIDSAGIHSVAIN